MQQCPPEENPAEPKDTLINTINHNHISGSPPQMIQKRKRSINPQAEENFMRALEAVRYGGIGFCKAAKMYGVNNRTLWLEYKKRGYPNNRISIKNRKQEFVNTVPMNQEPENTNAAAAANEMKADLLCTTSNGTTTLVNAPYLDSRHVELSPILQRPRYLDTTVNINTQHTLGLAGVSFEQM